MTLEDIESAVRQAGYFSTRDMMHDRTICASTGRVDGALGGVSFCVSIRSGYGLLSTWAPRMYRLETPERLPEICVAWLRHGSADSTAEIPPGLREQYALTEVSAED